MASEDILKSILNFLPNHYKKSDGSNNYQFLLSFAESYNTLANQISILKNDIQLSTAYGDRLDDVGELFNLIRNINESDVSYRARIKAYWSSLIGGGTVESISKSLSSLLGIAEDDITITHGLANMQIDIAVSEDLTFSLLDSVRDNVTTTKAAGVGLQKLTFSSANNVFRTNVSVVNGEDRIL